MYRSVTRRTLETSTSGLVRPCNNCPVPVLRSVSVSLTYDYAIIRVVPRVERGELINVGVILSCPDVDFLEARIELDPSRLLALDASLDVEATRANLQTIPACAGAAPRRERSASCRSAAVFTGSSRRAAPSSSARPCTPGEPTIQRRRWSACSTRWCGRNPRARHDSVAIGNEIVTAAPYVPIGGGTESALQNQMWCRPSGLPVAADLKVRTTFCNALLTAEAAESAEAGIPT